MPKTKYDALMEALLAFLDRIPLDKRQHAIGGFVVAYVAAVVVLAMGLGREHAGALSALALVSVALGKEFYDVLHRDVHTPDVRDALATIIGGLPVLLFLYFMETCL